MPEVRVEIPADDLAVLDGYCSATGKSRTDIIKGLLADWSERKLHEATIVLRVARRNPTRSECDRSVTGVRSECDRSPTPVWPKSGMPCQ